MIKSGKYIVKMTTTYTLMITIDINIKFDRTLSKFNDPNAMIEQLIENESATAIFTDGSKSIDSKSVGCASICLEHSTLSTISKTKMSLSSLPKILHF